MATATRTSVSIAIPTYNRASKLERAIRSALNQTYSALEVCVVDNASTDETEEICRRLVSEDCRVRYVRQPTNVGPMANFVSARDLTDSEFFMWLGDDDWIDPDYVETCLALLQDTRCAVAGGTSVYLYEDGSRRAGTIVEVCGADPAERVLEYYQKVTDNALFYGVYRRAALVQAPLKNVLGGDWLMIAQVLLTGTGRTAPETRIWREMGISSTWGDTLRVMSAPAWYRHFPYPVIAAKAFAEIAWEAPKYAQLIPTPRRLELAARAALSIVRRYRLDGRPMTSWMRSQVERALSRA
jgi:glycosyltransferase involved in cell wall biosynthesis